MCCVHFVLSWLLLVLFPTIMIPCRNLKEFKGDKWKEKREDMRVLCGSCWREFNLNPKPARSKNREKIKRKEQLHDTKFS